MFNQRLLEMMKKTDYRYYYDDYKATLRFAPNGINCVDDRVEQNRLHREKILKASRTKVVDGFDKAIEEGMIKINKAIAQSHYDFVNELIEGGISFEDAEQFVKDNFDFTTVKIEKVEDEYFIVIYPKMKEVTF